MKRILTYILFVSMLIGVGKLAEGINYFYLSDEERSDLGEIMRFFNADTAWGPVHSNDTIHMIQSPVFYDVVSTSAPSFGRGPAYNPQFLGPEPVFNAPEVPIPQILEHHRESAMMQGNYFDVNETVRARVELEEGNLHITWGVRGTPFGIADQYLDRAIQDDAFVFFECPIWVSGTCYNKLSLAAAGDVYLEDNILYPSTDTLTGIPSQDETAQLAILSEGSIIIANTLNNGRNNSAEGSGIIVNAYLAAVGGSIAFAQQNDVWESYRCDCSPDERGVFRLYGGTTQRRHGYVHRANNGGTGYVKNFHWDERDRHWNFWGYPINLAGLDTVEVDFGEVLVGSTAYDTIAVPGGEYVIFSGALAYPPFYSNAGYSYYRPFNIPVSFAPQYTGFFSGQVSFFLDGAYHAISLRGSGILPDTSSAMTLSLSPNPFNATTTLEFILPQAGDVELIVYDVLGREAKRMNLANQTAGHNRIFFDANSLPSGVYFARLSAAGQTATKKLMLVK